MLILAWTPPKGWPWFTANNQLVSSIAEAFHSRRLYILKNLGRHADEPRRERLAASVRSRRYLASLRLRQIGRGLRYLEFRSLFEHPFLRLLFYFSEFRFKFNLASMS